MKKTLLLTAALALLLSAREISSTNEEPSRASYGTVSINDTAGTEAVQETPTETASTEAFRETPKETRRERPPVNIQPIFTGGLQIYSSRYSTGVMALNLEGGVLINRKHMHTAEGYVSLFSWNSLDYKVDRVWGINYNYLWLNNFGTNFIRLDLGAKAGYNYYGEIQKLTDREVKTVTFGGPRAALNFKFGKLGIGGGYTMLCGYREFMGEKEATRVDQFSFSLGVHI